MRYTSSQSYHTLNHWQSNKPRGTSEKIDITSLYCGSLVNKVWHPVWTYRLKGFEPTNVATSGYTVVPARTPPTVCNNIIEAVHLYYYGNDYWVVVGDKESNCGLNADEVDDYFSSTINFNHLNGEYYSSISYDIADITIGSCIKLNIDTYKCFVAIGDKPDWIVNYVECDVPKYPPVIFQSTDSDNIFKMTPYYDGEFRMDKIMDIFGTPVSVDKDSVETISGAGYTGGSTYVNYVYETDDEIYICCGGQAFSKSTLLGNGSYRTPIIHCVKWCTSIESNTSVQFAKIADNLYSTYIPKVVGIL